MSIDVINFGCRLNIAEGAAIMARLDGRTPRIVVNSCAVTAEAVRQARQAVRRQARARPGVPIVVTGCAAITDRAAFASMPEVAEVVDKAGILGARPAVSGDGHARAFVEVQNGCDHDCTFCVTTIARGPARSHDVATVVREVEAAVERGHREVVLTGVDLTSFRPSLAGLVGAILRAAPALPRLRLSSLDPAEIDEPLFELLTQEPRIMPHVHLSLQSGDSMVLKRMKRRHTPEQAIALVERLASRRSGITIGADLIAGFPTETDAMHENSLAIMDGCNIVFAHVFPYSPRPGTAAARMPQVAPEVARRRARALRDKAAARAAQWRTALTGSLQDVLVERDGVTGHAPNFARIVLDRRQVPGTIVTARVMRSDGDRLTGTAAA